MNKICLCGNEMNYTEFPNHIVYTCDSCKAIKSVEKECEHDWIVLKLIISNGAFQVRKVYRTCFEIDDKSLKASEFKDLPIKEMQKIKDYVSSLNFKYYKFIEEWRNKYSESFHLAYEKYLLTNTWKQTRLKMLKIDNHTCQICNFKAEEVHHLTYKHLGNEFMFELISLCKNCHNTHYHDTQRTT